MSVPTCNTLFMCVESSLFVLPCQKLGRTVSLQQEEVVVLLFHRFVYVHFDSGLVRPRNAVQVASIYNLSYVIKLFIDTFKLHVILLFLCLVISAW